MSPFTKILHDLFYDHTQPEALLKKHHLFDFFESSITSITDEMARQPVNAGRFGVIASSILVSVNTRLRLIADPIEKGYLESILKDVANELISRAIISSGNREKLLGEIIAALEMVSTMHGYNYEALISLLKLRNSELLLSNSFGKNGYYYQWNGKENDLDELVRNLKSENWILSVRDFRTLFDSHDGSLKINFSSQKLIELVALFDELKSMKLITPKGGRGHFHPLKAYLVDFENNVLFQLDPKKIKMMARRGANKWAEHTRNAQKWISGYNLKDTFRLPLQR